VTGHKNAAAYKQSGLNGRTSSALPSMKYPLYGRIIIASLQFVLARFDQAVHR
jgi:hypothetical protein